MRITGQTPKRPGPPTRPKPTPNANKDKEPVQVFCRLRPLSYISDLVAVHKVPTNPTLFRLSPPNTNRSDLFYKFKQVFDENTTQKELFDKIANPLVTDLVNGKNGLLFTYGITSSGKTFTIVGTPFEPGILPRSLDILFNTLNKHNLQSRKYVFKPDGSNYFQIQSSPEAMLQLKKEQNEKIVIKTPSSTPFGSKTPRSVKKKENNEEWEQRAREDNVIEDVNLDRQYAIFISYVEIYNNYIYDLLDESLDVLKSYTRQPQSKVLREDGRRRVFVNGGTEVEVKSADEAFELFIKGVRRRRIAHTNLNTESSRSHSVFTIRVVQAPVDSTGFEVVQDNHFLITSQLSIVDLAGSERTVRTKNTGDRLREAGNINNSLMALRNCIDILRENQMSGTNKVVPYRDNKLTHLFKSYFEGEGKVKMVICVNPSAHDYDETLHLMKFAETSQEVLISRGLNRFCFNRFETIPKFYENGTIDLTAINVVGPPFPTCFLEDPEDDKVFPEWLECLEQRKRNRESKFEAHKNNQFIVRQRVAEMERENMYLKQQLAVVQMDLVAREDRIKNYENKIFHNERSVESREKKISDLDRQLNQINDMLEEKDRQLSASELEKERMRAKMKERLHSERDRLKNIFERILAEKQAQLEKEQCVVKDKMTLVKEILNADNTNLDYFKEYRDLFASNVNFRPSCGQPVGSHGSTDTPQTTDKRRSEFFHYGTPLATTCTNIANTPQTVGSSGAENTPSYNPPVVNPRHRRSLSTDNEKWIDHRPPGTLELGTVFRNKIKNKKSVSNLKAADILKDASKYALTHHEADQDGHVETHVYKGEVIPSTSGGVQVIYNDVETLKQGSPPFRKRTVSDTRLLSPHNQVVAEAEVHNLPVNTKRSRH